MNVLVCEDDEIVQKVIEVTLAQYPGMKVTVARDGIRALELLRKQQFDLIITDIHMPFHNGDEVLHLVRVEQKRVTPIVMISSDTEEEVVALALKSGVNAFVEKPLDSKKLSRALRPFLS